jgi:hypothetical protein
MDVILFFEKIVFFNQKTKRDVEYFLIILKRIDKLYNIPVSPGSICQNVYAESAGFPIRCIKDK